MKGKQKEADKRAKYGEGVRKGIPARGYIEST